MPNTDLENERAQNAQLLQQQQQLQAELQQAQAKVQEPLFVIFSQVHQGHMADVQRQLEFFPHG